MSNMDATHSIKSLTDDILSEVEEHEQQEKTASEKPRQYTTGLAKELFTMSQSLRKMAEERDTKQVSYDDLKEFRRRAGV